MRVLLGSAVAEYAQDPEAFRRRYPEPMLLWNSPTEMAEDFLLGTLAADPNSVQAGQSVLFELVKGKSSQNAFPLGITVGRTENNDIFFPDNSVSRFHAWFQRSPSGEWQVVDAESRNGTFVAGERLPPRGSAGLKDGDELRFGDVRVTFLPPSALDAHLSRLLESEY